jgi:predicted GNAT superfamily acetyltransferase
VAAVPKARLRDYVSLARSGFGFDDIDVVPPWYVHTMTSIGGFTLGAFANNELVGYNYSLPGYDGAQPYLYGCGLVVRSDFRGRGIAYRLKRAQHDRALEAGYKRIRWTTGSLSAPQLHLYLSKLGARLVGLHSGMLDGLVSHTFADEVVLDWRLPSHPPRAEGVPGEAIEAIESSALRDGLRRCEGLAPEFLDTSARAMTLDDPHDVEIPWDVQELVATSPGEVLAWRTAVRAVVLRLTERGHAGVELVRDPSRKRAFVRFAPAGASR